MTPRIVVVGSVNLDLVAVGATLPAPGETVTGATLGRYPGGKGANQALAARRLGAEVRMVARVGRDAFAEEALALLRAEAVDLADCGVDDVATTGVALIAVSASGENQIMVASGANMALAPQHLPTLGDAALILQLEIPLETNLAAIRDAGGFVAVNLAPAAPVPDLVFERADLIVVNEGEAATCGPRLHAAKGLVAVTLGARGAELYASGRRLAAATPPRVRPVDTTGAGDAFVAALTVALLEGQGPGDALAFACATGALAATRPGAQTSLPRRAEVEAILAGAPT